MALSVPSPLRSEQVAEGLLLSYLSPAQRYLRQHYGWFYVRTRNGPYALGDGLRAYACDKRGVPIKGRSFFPQHHRQLPRADNVLAQMLLLKADFHAFNRMACVGAHSSSGIRTPYGVALDDGRYYDWWRSQEHAHPITPIPVHLAMPPRNYWPPCDGLFGA